jgi:cell division septation protein DedD
MQRMHFLAVGMAMAALGQTGAALADPRSALDAWARGDYVAAVKTWQGDAAKGDADALFNLGQAHKLGRGVPQDLAKAEELFGRAAAQGHILAADNYGLLLFQRGARAQALPFIRAAADRGDPRAQYLLGIGHFNGDIVAKDWTRAYALVSLAQQAGLAPAAAALGEMDQYVPMKQRQDAVVLAAELRSQTDATRARQLAAVDLDASVPGQPEPMGEVTMPKPSPQPSAGDSPATAGADYARPPVTRPNTVSASKAAPLTAAPASAPWRVQLGAFGIAANADALWNRLKARPELSGKPRLNVKAGAVTKLQAGGFASEGEARTACAKLSASGQTCLVVRN